MTGHQLALDAERRVLGAMMFGGTEKASRLLKPDDFCERRHALIFEHLVALWAAGEDTDPVAVLKRLSDRGQLTRPETAGYMHEIMASAAGPERIGFYAAIVLDETERRWQSMIAEKMARATEIDDPEARRARIAEIAAEIAAGARPASATTDVAERFPSLDWSTAYQTDFTQIDWLPGRFMERGQQVALVGDGKVGKSLFALDWAFRMSAGRSFLGDGRHVPLNVLYLDRENSLRDVITRAQALGAAPDDLRNLTYKQFPGFTGSLDSSGTASRELLALVGHHHADVVVIDTVSRFIAGKENDSDTWIQLYQHIHQHLKARGVACLRLDHFGKDAERGARGNSAKSQDVDHVWELSRLNSRTEMVDDTEVIHTTMKLARTHTRTGLGEDLFTIGRKGARLKGGMWLNGQTRHLIVDNGVVAQLARETDVIVDELIMRGVPKGLGRDGLKTWMKQAGMTTFSNSKMADVVKALIERQMGG